MPDKRRHRGQHPLDKGLFAQDKISVLRCAVEELSWLLGRGYPPVASLKIVGDKHRLQKRQRMALQRSSCAEKARISRNKKQLFSEKLRGRSLVIDGFNCIICVEAALSGGIILIGRDGAYRDLASVHGSYRRVIETPRALENLHAVIKDACPRDVTWYLDKPVSNSGILAAMIRKMDVNWTVELVYNPDRELVSDEGRVVASSDAWVLDQCGASFDLTGLAIAKAGCTELAIDLGPKGP